jgi:molybdopterin synthase sulfur carrier subunit
MAIVRLRGQLEKLAGGASELQVESSTVSELLRQLEETHTGLEGWILDERGVLRRHINVFVNGEPAEPDTAIDAKDRIEILPAISGG